MNRSTPEQGMSPIVRTVCRWVKPFILLYGIQVILYGHLTPGGGFAGGVIAAAAFVLVLLAEGSGAATRVFPEQLASKLDSIGVLCFWAIALLGLFVTGTYFVNFIETPEAARMTLFSSGIVAPSNLGIGLKVCSSLFLVVLMLTIVRTDDGHSQEKTQ